MSFPRRRWATPLFFRMSVEYALCSFFELLWFDFFNSRLTRSFNWDFSGSLLQTYVYMLGSRHVKKISFYHHLSYCWVLLLLMIYVGADGIVINMVVGGEVATLKALEETSGLLIAEMPIHVRYMQEYHHFTCYMTCSCGLNRKHLLWQVSEILWLSQLNGIQ